MTTLLCGFYQMGFVARDLDHALMTLGNRYGVARFRRKRSSEWLESAHAWLGNTMIEVLAVGSGAPSLYDDHIPVDPAAVRLHHHGYRAANADAWAAINRQVVAAGLAAPMRGAVMDGQLNYMYVDTRADLGIYSEYVYLTGAATGIYDDVPRT